MKINFLKCNNNLAKQLSEVALNAYRAHYLHLWHDNGVWYMHRNFRPETFLQALQDPFSQFFLLLTEGGVVGFLKTKTFDNQIDTLELERIYLIRSATGKGIGQIAIRFVENLAKEQSKTRLITKAMDTATDAIRFYEKVGFQEISRFHLDFEAMKKEFRGMVVMEKNI